MLPLVVILTFTALKDGIEDYRRASLDDEVNNSAATKLGDWRNVNQPKDPRNWFQRLLNIGPAPGKASKGVRKLREKEALQRQDLELHKEGSPTQRDVGTTSMDSSDTGRGGDLSTVRSLDDIYSVSDDSRSMSIDHSYPPTTSPAGPSSTSPSSSTVIGPSDPGRFPNIASSYAISTLSHKSVGVVDWQRQTPGTARWERTLWKKLEVGDLVLLRDNDQVPADIVVLSTSDADGLCYIETKNLDGETNLKPRRSLKATCTITSEEDLEHAAFYLDSEPPHPNLYSYNGVLKYSNRSQPDEAEKMEPVTINELLLRGCTVRNTSWIVGLVAFTGPDTKIMLNGGDTPSKRSKIEKETNFNVIMNFIILILMCTVTAIVSGWYNSKSGTSADFFEIDAEPTHSPAINALVTFV
jgi:phospholipid-translocating ATPase